MAGERARFTGAQSSLRELRRRSPVAAQLVEDAPGVPGAAWEGIKRGANWLTYPVFEAGREAKRIAQSGVLQQPLISTPGMEASERELQRQNLNVGVLLPGGVRSFAEGSPSAAPVAMVTPENFSTGTTANQALQTPTAPAAPIAVAPTTGNFEDFAVANQGIGLRGQQTLEGPRIIRRPGQPPILTNLTGPDLEAGLADQRSFVRAEDLNRTTVLNPETNQVEGVSPYRTGAPATASNITTQTPGVVPQTGTAPTGIRRGPKLYTIGDRPRMGSSFLGAMTSLGMERARETAETKAQQRGIENQMAERSFGLSERQTAAQEATAEAAGIRARADLAKEMREATKPVEVGKFQLSAPKPDPNGVPYTDPVTGEPRQPMLPGSVRIGDTEFPMTEADFGDVQARTNELMALVLQDPTATQGMTTEQIANRVGEQAVRDIIQLRYGKQVL